MASPPPLLPQLPTGLSLPFAQNDQPSIIDQLTSANPADISSDYLASFPDVDPSSTAGNTEDENRSIIANLPSAQQRLTKKYTTLREQIAGTGISDQAYNAVLQFDAQRVARGAQPLTNDQTSLALLAAQTQAPVTQPPERDIKNVPGNAISDIRDIVTALPKLPFALWDEVQQLPNIGTKIAEAEAKGANPITAIAQAPGIRLIPGAFTIGNVARGKEGFEELATHPIQTLLDILPYATKAASLTKVGQAAEASAAAAKAAQAAGDLTQPIRPLRAVLTRSLDASGDLVPNKLGQLGQALMDTGLGRTWQRAFSQPVRDLSTAVHTASWRAMEMLSGKTDPAILGIDPGLVGTLRDAAALTTEKGLKAFNIARDDIPQITQWMQEGNWRSNPAIPAPVKGFIGHVQGVADRLGSEVTMLDLMKQIGGEYYDLGTAKRLTTAEDRLNRAASDAGKTIPRLQAIAGGNTQLNDLITKLQDAVDPNSPGTFKDANDALTNINRQFGRNSPFSGVQVATAQNIKDAVKKASTAEKWLERVKANNAPTRFKPMIQSAADKELGNFYVARGADPGDVAEIIMDRNYSQLDDLKDTAGNPIDTTKSAASQRQRSGMQVRMDYIDDIKKTWQAMKAAGADPVFLHRVNPEAADRLGWIKAYPGSTSLSQTKLATYSPIAYINDVTVALDHQAHEVARRLASDELMDKVMNTWGRTRDELIQHYFPQAKVQALSLNGAQDAMTRAESLLKRDYADFTPKEFVSWSGSKTSALDPERVYLPRAIADNMKLIYGDQDAFSKLLAPLQPINSAYRTAVLPLSAKFHANNLINNMIQMGTNLGPGVFTKVSAARDLLKAVREGTAAAVPVPDALRAELTKGAERSVYADTKFAAGSSLGRWWNQMQEAKNAAGLGARSVDRAGGLISKAAEKSFDVFEFHEGMARAMAYLYGYDKSIAKGLSSDAAQAAGLETAFKTIQDLSQLTPIERSVIRNVVPFYGYMQHLIRYMTNFPADHPMRAAIMTGIARMETEDHATGLPDAFRSMIPIGTPDSAGNQIGISTSALNPFSDAADLLTFAGFVSQLNPVFKTVAQQLGIDTFTGSADLHPNVHYDPATGQMALDAGNPITQLAYNTVPQAQLLAELVGTNKEFQQIMASDPGTAERMLASQVGLPVYPRNINLRQANIRSELDRAQDRQAVMTEALKTGDDSQVKLWPGLQPLVDQIRVLQTGGRLSPYASGAVSPGAASALAGAATSPVAPQARGVPQFAQKFLR